MKDFELKSGAVFVVLSYTDRYIACECKNPPINTLSMLKDLEEMADQGYFICSTFFSRGIAVFEKRVIV